MGKIVYFVEDDNNIRELVIYALQNSGFEAVGFECAADLYDSLKENIPDLMLLDIMLPDEDGLQILDKLRNRLETRDVPVIMLTAKDSEYDKIKGLDSGADDYVTKPFGVMELISRVKAVLRRAEKKVVANSLSFENIVLDSTKHEVHVNGKEIILTYKEFELLHHLMKHPNIVLTREKLLELVWNTDYMGETRTVDVHIGSLRQKLAEAGQYIHTVRGVGYKLS